MLSCIYNQQIATVGIDRHGYSSRYVTVTRVLFLLMAVALWLACADASYGAIIINAPMTDTNASGWVLGGNPNPSFLTGNGTTDPVGQGWLRLTNNSGNQTGFAYNDTSFDLSGGLLIQYDYVTWGGTGADGYSIFLFDALVSTFNIGAFGGSLGYAQKLPPTVNPAVPGISGGYVGIGIDEYGNFSSPTEGRYLGPGLQANTVSIRGTVVGFGGGAIGQTAGATSYPWIATSANNGSLWYNGATRPDQTSTNYRKVVIRITPAPNPTVDVWIQFGYNQPLTQMITGQALPAISTSQLLKIGYAASTGGSTNYHEIRNLLVTSLNTSTAIDLGITKTASVATATVGNPITYTVTARNYGPNNVQATGVGIVDNVPASMTGVTWTCAVVAGSPAGTSCGAVSGSGNTINTTATLPRYGAVVYTISGTVSTPVPSQLSNNASLTIPGSVIDYNPNNDSATISIPVTSTLVTSTKTVVDIDGGSYLADDILQYTIILTDNGGAASGVSVSDTIDANLTNFNLVSCPSGATCSYNTGTRVFSATGINVPTNGSVTIVYTANISNSAIPGTTITNTATVTNPSGTGATPAAPVVTVAGTTTGTGNKPLYLYDNASSPPQKLSRIPMTVNATSYVEIPEVTTYTWTLSPVLASAVTLSSGNIPVRLWLTTINSRTYTIPVTLRCGATTVASNLTGSIALTAGNPPVAFNVTLPLASNYTCAAGNAFYLDVRNGQSGSGTRNIRVYPAPSAGNYSYINLPSQNVVNVNSIRFYDAAFSGGNLLSSVPVGSTVFIRTVVSDPFGSYDIFPTGGTAPTITIKDPSNNTLVNAVAMTLVYTDPASPSLSKIYEYSYAMPSSPTGNWSVSVMAAEGTEGTVTNTAYATMPVVVPLPNLFILKFADKSNASPGEVITYTIQMKNDGTGEAHTVTLTDSLGNYNALAIAAYSGSPFNFSQGSPTSGLTLGIPTYSNDHGATYTYTLVSGSGGAPAGYDGVVTDWKILMNNNMNPNGGNFTLNYKSIVK